VPARTERFALAALLLAGTSAGAEAPRWPTPQKIDQAVKERPFPGAEALAAQPVPRPPILGAPAPALDLESLARAGARLPEAAAAANAPPALRIFVTLEMPAASLRLLVDQAARSGATLVLRGLKAQSLRVTLETVRALIGERPVAWTIDPEAFTRFGVQQAPTFVLALADAAESGGNCGTACAAPASFLSVAGDVSLDHALGAMLRHRPATAPRIEPLLTRLRAS